MAAAHKNVVSQSTALPKEAGLSCCSPSLLLCCVFLPPFLRCVWKLLGSLRELMQLNNSSKPGGFSVGLEKGGNGARAA